MAKKTIPAISVIIPMYNAKDYIAECLDSILAQTFDDYEVIVVDDCSTDDSANIVESYIPKFKDRLQLVRSKVNSGSPATPQNIGIRISHGEYIVFMDNDDVMMENALKKFYSAAKKFNADVVHFDNFYRPKGDFIDKKNLEKIVRMPPPSNSPTCLPEDLSERVKMFVEFRFRFETWCNIVNRDFLMKERLKFEQLSVAADMLFGFFLICSAPKIVVIPDIPYVWRKRKDSVSSANLPPDKCIQRRGGDVMRAVKLIDEFANKIEFFKTHPQFKQAALDFFAQWGGTIYVVDLYSKVPAFQLDALVRREVEQIGECDALTAYLFGRMNVFNVNIIKNNQIIRQQQAQIQQLQARLQQSQNSLNINNEDIFKI